MIIFTRRMNVGSVSTYLQDKISIKLSPRDKKILMIGLGALASLVALYLLYKGGKWTYQYLSERFGKPKDEIKIQQNITPKKAEEQSSSKEIQKDKPTQIVEISNEMKVLNEETVNPKSRDASPSEDNPDIKEDTASFTKNSDEEKLNTKENSTSQIDEDNVPSNSSTQKILEQKKIIEDEDVEEEQFTGDFKNYSSSKDQKMEQKVNLNTFNDDPSEAFYCLAKSYWKGTENLSKNIPLALEHLENAVKLGNPEAQFVLGSIYLKGENVKPDAKRAVTYLMKAAKQGHSGAQNLLAECYEEAKGVEKELKEEAFKLYKKSAKQNNAFALSNLGRCYQNGIGVDKDLDKAIKAYTEAAELENAYAQYALGCIYRKGLGIPVDNEKAAQFLQKSVDQGRGDAKLELGYLLFRDGQGSEEELNKAAGLFLECVNLKIPDAFVALGNCFEKGLGVLKDPIKAFDFYSQAAKQGSITGHANLGRCYEFRIGLKEVDIAKANHHYKIAAKGNDTYAQYAWGYNCRYSKGMKEPDFNEALRMFRDAAKKNDKNAQRELGLMYLNNIGGNKDLKKARKWLQLASDQGDRIGQTSIGWFYEKEMDFEKAFIHYQKAAEQKYVPALNHLGRCFQNGTGIGIDLDQAIKAYAEAAESNDYYAQNALGMIYVKHPERNRVREGVELLKKSAKQLFADGCYHLGMCYLTGINDNEGKCVLPLDKKLAEEQFIIAANKKHKDAQEELKEIQKGRNAANSPKKTNWFW